MTGTSITTLARHKLFRTIVAFSVLAVSTNVLAHYLQWQPEPLIWAVLFVLSFAAFLKCPSFKPKSRVAIITPGLYSALLDLSLLLGYHIALDAPYPTINGKIYAGLSFENTIAQYSFIDLFAVLAMLPSLFMFSYAIYAFIAEKNASSNVSRSRAAKSLPRVNPASFIVGVVVLVLLWIPYLLTYWPGLLFGDSLVSLRQALGMTAWDNHHPVAFTAFISLCMKAAHAFNLDNTAGCAIYSFSQMLFLACCFSYTAQWLVSRGHLRPLWGVIVLLGFGLTPFIAIYSIAMWKDPVFSAALMMMSLMLFDIVETEGNIVYENRLWLPMFITAVLIVCLLRSNGLLIAIAVSLVLLLMSFKRSEGYRAIPQAKTASVGAIAALVASLLFLGPISSALHIEKVGSSEGTGILYNQMARVVVFEGNMDDANEQYLSSLLPIEQYESTYRPCCFDNLKYAFQDNGAYFGMRSLLLNWSSMLVNNPSLYLEAWELQTFGFWAINQPELASYLNIAGGVPRNTIDEEPYSSQLENEFEIEAASQLPGDASFWRTIFVQDMWTPPSGFLFWISLYLICLCFITGKRKWALPLLPTLLLFLSMFIATPIAYWPRYVAAAYFLVPFFALLFYLLLKPSSASRRNEHRPRKRAR
ncbi:MAG: hypothetical protein IKF56_04025 [Eggerthellaceae bacterium]|nr:hypothetical protein [Eggerthellaceae bacterium]